MANPLLVFRIGRMKKYAGFDPSRDPITRGGTWVANHGWGGEMWNFLPRDGRCYGYAMSKSFAGLDLDRIKPLQRGKWEKNQELSGVDIVFIARDEREGQVVVGWYEDATIFHRKYRSRPNPTGTKPRKNIEYLCQTDMESAFLVPEGARTEKVAYAPADGYGPGQSNIWYADKNNAASQRLVDRLRRYIRTAKAESPSESPQRSGGGRRGGAKPDKKLLLKIENNSMDAVHAHFNKKYDVDYVHRDCCGWDMTATHKKSGTVLQLEVKGHLGDVIQFDLTPNEYAKMQELQKTYRVCVVRRALKSKKVEVYTPKEISPDRWRLRDRANGLVVDLAPKIAAHASEIS